MEFCSDVLTKHVYKNLFLPIIQYSDVGIDPDAEEEMETIQPFGRQAIEEEMEMNNEDEQEDEAALQVYEIYVDLKMIILYFSLIINFFREN
jgi:hypothetical protein